MKTIDCTGVIVGDDDKELYEYVGYKAVCPNDFKKVLDEVNGEEILVIINSPGGSVYAASEIYTALRSYNGKVSTQIQSIAASAASYIAMAGECEISPTGQIMIHNVSTGARGDYRSMEHAAEVLKKANKSIANAYIIKTGISEEKLLQMMDKETWFTAEDAVKYGFADKIMFNAKLGKSENNKSIGSTCTSIDDRINKLKLVGKYNRLMEAKVK